MNNLRYIAELDGMRGSAILAVMIYHAGAPFLKGGFIGVDVFFILSGFLITSLIVYEYDSTSSLNLKNFYIRRLLRLAPALFLLLIVFILLSVFFLNEDKTKSNLIDAIITLFYMSNWARALSIHPPDYLGHTWSLSIEEQFYILWPFTLLILLRIFTNRWIITLLALFLAISAWAWRVYLLNYNNSPYERLYNGLDTRADTLMIGCTLGIILSSNLLNNNIKIILSKLFTFIAPIAMISLIFFSVTLTLNNPKLYYWGFFAVEILTSIILLHLFINENSIIHKLLSMKWLIWVGSISYSLYLWHYPIYRTMQSFNCSGIQIITIGTLITFIISIFSFYMLEKPILKLKKFFKSGT